ncbi:MAG: cupin domain-containing protein [Pseudonocardia sp.]|nr:cupin domain-containing protein [Pseudonocardia sp.]
MTLTPQPSRTARVAAVLLGAGVLLGACAQPGQLGQPLPAAAAPASVAAPAAPATVAPATGTVDARVTVRTPGPAVYSVRTVVLAPGETQEWHRHPGTEMAIVRSGAVTLEREGGCTPARFGEGQALFVGDGVPHRLANDRTAPAELVVTTLLAPGAAERETVPSPCPEG